MTDYFKIANPPNGKCRRCKKRERYVYCRLCAAPLCAMCSWWQQKTPESVFGDDERCRECAEL